MDSLSIHTVWQLGPLGISETVVTTWGIMVALWLGSLLLTRSLQSRPSRLQVAVEGAIIAMQKAIAGLAPNHVSLLLPFMGTLWIFLVIANLLGLIPGLNSPTRDLSATAAMAIVVFLATLWFGIRAQGLRGYLHHYLSPSPILLPFHIISEISRTLALAVRLFGNMMSLEMAALLILLVAGFLVPVPILMLHVIEALVQAYIFGMLALLYIAGGLQSEQRNRQKHAPAASNDKSSHPPSAPHQHD